MMLFEFCLVASQESGGAEFNFFRNSQAVRDRAKSPDLPAVWLRTYTEMYFNEAGDIFGENGVLEESFPSIDAFNDRDVAKFGRRHKRAFENPSDFTGPFLWITDRHSHFYYHWLCDALPRLAAFCRYSSAATSRLMLPRRVVEQHFVRESLEYWPEFRLAEPPQAGGSGRVDQLHIVTRTNVTPQVNAGLINDVVHRFRASQTAGADLLPGRRIYVSRKQARVRRVLNESEIEPVLARHGFEIMVMESMPLDKQISLMAQTSVLAGPHGGGLTNMIFLPPGTPVIELRREIGPPACYRNLAVAVGHPWHVLVCKPEDESSHPHAGDIIVDPHRLDKCLSSL
jgi:capsular polysaccharide biosynthesis protein